MMFSATIDNRTFTLTLSLDAVTGNCGASLIYGIRLVVMEKPPEETKDKAAFSLQKSNVQEFKVFPVIGTPTISLKVLSDGLHEIIKKNKLLQWIEEKCKGFAIFTDNINYYLNGSPDYANFLVDDDKLESIKPLAFSTSSFVTFLIKNKIGAMGRGITTVNKRHEGSSVLTSWTWAPEKDMVLSMEQPFYAPMQVDKKNDRWGLKKLAADHNEREMKYGNVTRTLNVKKAAIRIPKRAGINSPRRVRKLP